MSNEFCLTLCNKSFEALRQINPYGAEYWNARDLQKLLGYSQWRRLNKPLKEQ